MVKLGQSATFTWREYDVHHTECGITMTERIKEVEVGKVFKKAYMADGTVEIEGYFKIDGKKCKVIVHKVNEETMEMMSVGSQGVLFTIVLEDEVPTYYSHEELWSIIRLQDKTGETILKKAKAMYDFLAKEGKYTSYINEDFDVISKSEYDALILLKKNRS